MKQAKRLHALNAILDEVRRKEDNIVDRESAFEKYKRSIPFDTETARRSQFDQDMKRLERQEWLEQQREENPPLQFGPGWTYCPDSLIKLSPTEVIKAKFALVDHWKIHTTNSHENRKAVDVADDIRIEQLLAFSSWTMERIKAGVDPETLTFDLFVQEHPMPGAIAAEG